MTDGKAVEDREPRTDNGGPGTAARRRAASMMDVARLAGVSHQTVSRVINGSPRVAPDTRDRVHAAMRMLDYRPSSLARALKTGRSRTIGVVSFDTTLYGPASTLFGVERAAHQADYFTSIVSVPELHRDTVLEAVDRLRRQGVEGILTVVPQRAAMSALGRVPVDVPLTAVEAGPEAGVAVVAVDQFAGAAAATRHLLELGHRSVVHVAGPSGWQESELRVAGWRETLLAQGLAAPTPAVGDWTPESGYAIGRELATLPDLSAIFVANDQMALGVLRALHEAGLRVPEHVSVVGFDAIPESAFFMPPLTTVRQDFLEMGRQGFRLLQRQIDEGRRSDARITIAPELVVRSSTRAVG
jgi:DNA-binding LacI/PurR family transcriptional regulator